jgi:hypothetical protein
VKLSWEGPFEPLLRGPLARTGWRLAARGRRPAVPAPVSLSGELDIGTGRDAKDGVIDGD